MLGFDLLGLAMTLDKRSAAFMHYLDVEGLEAGAVQQAHFQDSSEDEVVEREGPVPLDFPL